MKRQGTKEGLKSFNPFIMIIVIVIVMFLLTFIIPSGSYERVLDPVSNQEVVDPDSYTVMEKEYLGILDFLSAFPTGLVNASNIMMFMFIICGVFQIITATGAIDAGVKTLAVKMKDKGIWTIPLFMIVFSVGGATFGLSNEIILYVPIGIALVRLLGYDSMTGFSMIAWGAWIGYCTGWLNPFNVGVAQEIAGITLFSGIGMRLIFWVAFLIISCVFLMRYAAKIKKSPEKSSMYDLEKEAENHFVGLDENQKMTKRQIAVLLLLLACLVLIVWGTLTKDWFITEMGGVFIGLGVIAGLVGGLSVSQICDEFIEGAKAVLFGAFLVGMAQVIVVIVDQGQILDSIIYGLSSFVSSLPKSIAVIGMYICQTVINFFINSGTGQALATMPIMLPLAEINDISTQTAIAAFQFGDGLTNAIYPTSPVLMSALAVANIPYGRYLKFFLPLFIAWVITGGVFVVICQAIGY